jgi:hypothetical protein
MVLHLKPDLDTHFKHVLLTLQSRGPHMRIIPKHPQTSGAKYEPLCDV